MKPQEPKIEIRICNDEDLAKSKGFKQVGIGVEVNNPRAKKLYEKLGYKDWGHGIYQDRWIGVDSDGADVAFSDSCHYLVKVL